jgi:hypothetical protein
MGPILTDAFTQHGVVYDQFEVLTFAGEHLELSKRCTAMAVRTEDLVPRYVS